MVPVACFFSYKIWMRSSFNDTFPKMYYLLKKKIKIRVVSLLLVLQNEFSKHTQKKI